MKNALVIPVRLNSTRLPNKALKDINGISLIQRVVNQCLKTNVFTYVVTDSPEISSKVVIGSGGSIFYQNKKAESGTERIIRPPCPSSGAPTTGLLRKVSC